ANTFEFTVNDPAEWNNKGRYPIFSAMGCSAGQIHIPTFTLSDRYVQIADEGAIAFISGSGSQFPNSLISWARPWYDYFGSFNYGSTLGESIHYGLVQVNNFVNPNLNTSNPYRYLLEQQTTQGDPAIKLNPLPGPDYVIDRESVSISPQVLNTKLDSFDLQFNIDNIGRNLNQTGDYRIRLVTPDEQVLPLKQDKFNSSQFETVITVRLPVDAAWKAGAYRLLIDVDPDNTLQELPDPEAELNNTLKDNLGIEGIQVILLSHVVKAIYPEDFAIVNKTPILIASGSNAFEKHQDIAMEMDTTALFNSPMLVREKFLNHASLLKWTPQVQFVDGQVYYWRVSYDSIAPTQGYLWSLRSFIYRPGSPPGWNQSHFYQLDQNSLADLVPDTLNHDFDFESTLSNFRILNRYQRPNSGGIPFGFIDNIFYTEFFSKYTNANVNVFVVAVDPVTGAFMMNPNPGLYGSYNNLNYDVPCFPYRSDVPESRQAMIDFIKNVIPSGYYIFFYTYQRDAFPHYFPQQWASDETTFGQSIFSLVENQFPNSAIRNLATSGSVPYIVLFRKDIGGIQEAIAADTSEVISLSYDIKHALTKGQMKSVRIGPASKWYSIQYDIDSLSVDSSGTNLVSAFALSSDLSDTLWISHRLTSPDTVISDIDAAQYPYIRLTLETEDKVHYDPSDIRYWRVLYDGYPEFVINPDAGFEFIADTLFQGQEMSLRAGIENISDVDAQSVPVSLRILSGSTVANELADTIPELKAQQIAPVFFSHNTKAYAGDYQVLTEINADRNYPELDFTDNIGVLPMYVRTDDANPLLDVTFDGYHIKDGDVVAARPLIQVELHDENTYLRLDDTSAFDIYLEYPSDPEPRHVSFQDSWVSFIPASPSGKNIAIVRMTPYLNEDGYYRLRVNARDISGNKAGDNDYLISFRVINAPAVSHITNYPNPFSTSTRFIYTLTGEGAPAFYKIQIMSVQGIIVREISQDEIGPLAVGTHATEFAWDGTDQSGNELGMGIYFYRLIAKNQHQEDYPKYPLPDDHTYFENGWGKLVIIR
ncbi:MAG TPA: C25 family cysteine peptidase, partial [Saprospiraceae bacterium]|nr:C25 family cysteine peptidase [Saprospiraceae bacterium]